VQSTSGIGWRDPKASCLRLKSGFRARTGSGRLSAAMSARRACRRCHSGHQARGATGRGYDLRTRLPWAGPDPFPRLYGLPDGFCAQAAQIQRRIGKFLNRGTARGLAHFVWGLVEIVNPQVRCFHELCRFGPLGPQIE
jgi:hypothetical protein